MTLGTDFRNERGTTMAELVVGMGMAIVVLAALSTLIISSLHTTARVSARVDATQQARLTITKLINELHSACIFPRTSPMRPGSSDRTLIFIHATGASVLPIPTETRISLGGGSGEELIRSDYPYVSGTAPNWKFAEKPTSITTLMTKVTPITSEARVFTYYYYANGALLAQASTLNATEAAQTVQVKAALKVAPSTGGASEAATSAAVQGSATFRLTPPSFKSEAPSTPCQ